MFKKLLFTIALGLMLSLSAFAQTAKVQVIHNCADTSAALVDVYVNGVLTLDNFGFRKATPFVDLPSDSLLNFAIAPANSDSIIDSLVSFNFNFADNGKYVIVASGLISSVGYTPTQPFSLNLFSAGQITSTVSGNTDILVYHGATDAPAVDLLSGSVLIDNLNYGSFNSSYLQIPTSNVNLTLTDATGADTVNTYAAALATLNLQDSALVAVASGFLDPSINSNGASFGIWVALPSGGNLIQLPVVNISNTPTASVQLIHNCADKAARLVDVWINDSLVIDNFKFRTCSPFINLPTTDTLFVAIQHKDSTNAANPLALFTFNLAANESYVIVANGTISASGYNPSQPFNLDVFTGAQQNSSNPGNTDILVYHGVTDAAAIDFTSNLTTLVDSINYGQFSNGYLQIPTADINVELIDTTGIDTIAVYGAPLSTLNLQGTSLVVVASGFYNRSVNRNGSIFGLYAALPGGGNLIPLPRISSDSARVQIIHNSADVTHDVVDIWYNDNLLLDNIAFRESTPFMTMPAGVDFDLTIMDDQSTDTLSERVRTYHKLEANKTYIMVSKGNFGTTGYDPIVPMGFSIYDQGKENANNAANTSILFYHGASDVPVLDIVSSGSTLVDNILYEQFSNGYFELPTSNYTFNLEEAFGVSIIGTFTAPLSTLGLQGKAIVLLASGFINPGSNSNGEDWGAWYSLPTGGALIPLPDVTSLNELKGKNQLVMFPNPASSRLNILNPNTNEISIVNIYNQVGETVFSQTIPANGSKFISVELDQIANGLYHVEVINNNNRSIGKVSVLKM
ncbi:MAG TPA: DUF4397 domain-containing protein [Bacteroidia bacterium]|nr:DUF4397 domain-containing protein [Bacteroidia bacterium]